MTDTKEPVRKISQRIIGYRVKSEETPEPIKVPVEVKGIKSTKLERGEILYGTTYKVKQPALPEAYEHGFYITINNTNVDGELKPFEIFIETKNIAALPMVNILSFTLTTLFRQQIDISHLLEEYRSIQVGGGYRGKKHFWQEKPKYYNSVLGEIADVIEYHLYLLNLTNTNKLGDVEVITAKQFIATVEEPDIDVPNFPSEQKIQSIGICPDCKEDTMVLRDGCPTCTDCGYSKCG